MKPRITKVGRGQEGQLRELVAWYEWSDPPNLKVAGVLQDAADAVRVRALSPEAADALIAVWQPFAGLEAQVRNQPELMKPAETKKEFQRAIVVDMRRMVVSEKDPTRRVYLAQLLEEQIQNFEKGQHDGRQQRVG